MKSTACLLLLVCGCGVSPGTSDPPAQSPRERCLTYGVPEDYVEGQYILYRAALNDGFGHVATLVAADQVCQDACDESADESCRSDCYACNASIIDEVFTAAP